ncbi:MAG: ATP synthase F1 subunit delta [Myxococcales bacterium]|nr:ATP synthase F1 subunit delta [Myxococcales bacterium]MCB9731311.1 ATP synthase F1 subunit delta [Deltaproteobacteria bacterium]
MKESPIARRYAKALVELCAEAKNHAVIGKQLESFAETWDSSDEFQNVMKSPVVSLEDKREILNKLFARNLFAPTTRNFLFVLLDAGRIGHVDEISRAFAELMDNVSMRVRATVTSAVPMERSDLVRIQAALQRLTGKTVVLDAKVDPSLIGGVVTEIDNVVLDGSLKTQLQTLSERLLA